MKDKDLNFRGGCTKCKCPEYANDGSLRCADCRCLSSRHRILYSAAASNLKLPNISFDLNSITKYIQSEWPDANVIQKESDKWTLHVKRFIEKLPQLSIDFALADQKSAFMIDFSQRLKLASQTFLVLGILGILGFRGRMVYSLFLSSLYPVVLMSSILGCLISLYSYSKSKSSIKKTFSAMTFGINTISFFSYTLIYLGIAPKFYGPLGIPIQSAHFVNWLLNYPTFLHIFGYISGRKESMNALISKTQTYIITFLIASVLLSPWCEWVGSLGSFIFLNVFYELMEIFHNGISKTTKPKVDEHSLVIIRNIAWFVWVIVPITWILSAIGALGYIESELMYSMADIGAKFAITSVIAASELK